MTPLAILKDSIRENRDSKILLVLMIFSIIFAVLLLSMSFEPVSANAMYSKSGEFLPRFAFDHGKFSGDKKWSGRFNFDAQISDFKEIKAANNPANGKYSFVLTITAGDPKIPVRGPNEGLRKMPDPPTATDPKEVKKDPVKKELEKKEPEKKEISEGDPFMFAVFMWHTENKFFQERLFKNQANPIEEEKYLVTPDMIESWVKEIYNFTINAKIDKVTFVPSTKLGEYVFEIETGNSDPRSWPHNIELFFGGVSLEPVFSAVSLGQIVFHVQNYLTNGVGAAIAIILGVMITSFFIPNMLRKGAIDIMLSKPISRPVLLIYKYLGGVMFMLFFSTVAVGTVYIALGIRTGLWSPGPLLLIPLLTYGFAVLYAVNTFIAVWTRSGIAAMLVTLAFSGLLWLLSLAYNQLDQIRNSPLKEIMPSTLYTVSDVVNTVLPRTRDLDVISSKVLLNVMTDADQNKFSESKLSINYFMTFGVSGLYIVGFLALSCWIFSKKNF